MRLLVAARTFTRRGVEMTRSRVLAVAAALILPAAAMAETIEGSIEFSGKAPTPGKLHREADPYCAKKPMTDPAVTVKGGKLENVWVHVTKRSEEHTSELQSL